MKKLMYVGNVVTVFLVVISLISSSTLSLTTKNISNAKNLDLEVIKEETHLSVESLTGLAPRTISSLSTGLAPHSGNNIIPLDCKTMYGYTAALGPHGEGPCYFDLEDPGDIIQLSNEALPNFAAGGTWTCDEKWLVNEYACGALYEIDPEDGSITSIGGGGGRFNGLANDPTTTTLYGCKSKYLYKIDPETGETEYIGPFGISDAMIALAVNSYGDLYGWDVKFSGDSYLYEIDKETGEATQLFSLGKTLCYAQDGDFLRTEDILYLTAYIISPESGGYLCSVDIVSEELTVIGEFENSAQITGSMFKNTCFKPEHDVGVKKIVSPVDGDAGEDMDVIVKVVNYGNNTEEDISVNVVILKDGTLEEYNETEIIDELHPDELIDVEMPVWTPNDWQSVSNDYINYKITANISLEGDQNSRNDYKEKWFELYYGYFHDVGCINISGPETGPAQTFPVKVIIKNFGQYDECCFKTYVEISEVDPEYEDFRCTTTIEPGQEIDLVLDDWTPDFLQYETSGTKNYTVNVWTDMDDPPDENPDNDLITYSIILDYYHDVGIREMDYPKLIRSDRKFYAVDSSGYPSNSRFIWFDSQNPGKFYGIGKWPNTQFPQGATYDCDGVLWVCDTNGRIYTVDPETGEYEEVGSSGTGELVGLAYHEKTKVLYGMSTKVLYTIDMDTGQAIRVGSMGNPGLMISLDCDEWSGIMYAIELGFGTGYTYTLDLDTGKATKLGPTGVSMNFGQDIAYDCINETMYACVFNYATYRGELHWIDLETGKFNFIGVLQNGAHTTAFAIPGCCFGPMAYIPPGIKSIEAIAENVGTFPERDMSCTAEINEYITDCKNGTLVYEDLIENIDILTPLVGTETLTFDDYNFAQEGFYGIFVNITDDNDDNLKNNFFTWGVGCDDTHPDSSHTLDPPEPDGLNDYYISDLEVTLVAIDPEIGCDHKGSDVKEIKYQVNDGTIETITGSPGTFAITEDSTLHTVKYWAIDNVGNKEPEQSFQFKMDQTPPDIKSIYEIYKKLGKWYVNFICEALDDTSGMERVEMYINEGLVDIVIGPGPTYEFEIEWSSAFNNSIFKFVAFDFAGISAYDIIDGEGITSLPHSQFTIKQIIKRL